MELEQRLRYIRTDCGISQEELAERVEVSRQTISKWERGLAQPSAENLAALSKALGVSADALLNDNWTPPEPVIKVVEVPVPVEVQVPVEVPVEVRVPVEVPVEVQVPVEVPVEVRVPVEVPVEVRVPVEIEVPRPRRYGLLALLAALALAAGIAIGVLFFRERPVDSVPLEEMQGEVIDDSTLREYMPLIPLE